MANLNSWISAKTCPPEWPVDNDEYNRMVAERGEDRIHQVAEDDISFDDWFSGPARKHLVDFIEFCHTEGS